MINPLHWTALIRFVRLLLTDPITGDSIGIRNSFNLIRLYRKATKIHDTDLHAMVLHDTLVACQWVRDNDLQVWVDFDEYVTSQGDRRMLVNIACDDNDYCAGYHLLADFMIQV